MDNTFKSCKKMISKNILLSLISIILLISLASAFGVSSPYWEENPLIVDSGDTATVNLNLQNMAGNDDIKVKAELLSGSEITSLDNDTFLIKAGTSDTLVPLTIKMPENIPPGEKKSVQVEFKTISDDNQGVSMGTGMTIAFDVIAGQEIQKNNNLIIIISIVAIILAIILWIILKNKRGNKN